MNIFEQVKRLYLPEEEYIVVGSGPLVARNLKKGKDVDIVVSKRIFEQYKNKEDWKVLPWTYPGKEGEVFLRKGVVEFYMDVNCPDFNPSLEELLNRADILRGIPFISIEDMIRLKQGYYKLTQKEKHLKDIERAIGYLRKKT